MAAAPKLPAGAAETRKFSVELKHQFDHVQAQCERGLAGVKRTCQYMEAVMRACEHPTDVRKAAADAITKYDTEGAQLDECANFTTTATMLQEAMLHASLAAEMFRRSASSDSVTPLYAWYKTAQARRRDVVKEHQRMLATWAASEAALFRERNDCAKAYAELKAAAEARDREDATEKERPKLLRAWKDKKDTCVRKFAAFEKTWERTLAMQLLNDRETLPHLLHELELIERERLELLRDFTHSFGALFTQYADAIRSSATLILKVASTLDSNREVSRLFDRWVPRFGAPPTLNPVRFDLPATAASLQADALPAENALLASVTFDPATGVALPQVATTQPSNSTAAAPSRTASPAPRGLTAQLGSPTANKSVSPPPLQSSSTSFFNSSTNTILRPLLSPRKMPLH